METQRVVFDCNIFFQRLISIDGPSGQCVEAVFSRRVRLFWSPWVVAEVRRTASRLELQERFPQLRSASFDQMLDRLLTVAVMVNDVPEVFRYARDPDDAHYVNLAIAARARLIVSRDRDLLTLSDLSTPAGRDFAARFPSIDVVTPAALLRELDGSQP